MHYDSDLIDVGDHMICSGFIVVTGICTSY